MASNPIGARVKTSKGIGNISGYAGKNYFFVRIHEAIYFMHRDRLTFLEG